MDAVVLGVVGGVKSELDTVSININTANTNISATESTVNAINTNVNTILNATPFYKGKVMHVAQAYTTGSIITLVSVTGSGCLVSVAPPGGSYSGSMSAIVDGVSYTLNGGYYPRGLTLFWEFHSSLTITMNCNSGYGGAAAYYLN